MYAEQEIVIAKNVVHQKNVIPSSVQLNSCADILLQQLQAASCALETLFGVGFFRKIKSDAKF